MNSTLFWIDYSLKLGLYASCIGPKNNLALTNTHIHIYIYDIHHYVNMFIDKGPDPSFLQGQPWRFCLSGSGQCLASKPLGISRGHWGLPVDLSSASWNPRGAEASVIWAQKKKMDSGNIVMKMSKLIIIIIIPQNRRLIYIYINSMILGSGQMSAGGDPHRWQQCWEHRCRAMSVQGGYHCSPGKVIPNKIKQIIGTPKR